MADVDKIMYMKSYFFRYWYESGLIYPNMGTVWIAVDDADTQNGCLTVSQGRGENGPGGRNGRGSNQMEKIYGSNFKMM